MQIQESNFNIPRKRANASNQVFEYKSLLNDKIFPNQKFGKWTTSNFYKRRGTSKCIICKCDCGIEGCVNGYDLLRGSSIQCKSCNTRKRNLTHGQNQSVSGQITYEYRLWQNLKTENRLCEDWAKSFELFFKDIGLRPQEGLILLRKNMQHKLSVSNFFWGNKKLYFFKDLKGKKFGEWTVLEKDLLGKGIRWFCVCDCGQVDYITQSNLLNSISTKCRKCASSKILLTKHGKSKHDLFRIYHGMKARCYSKNSKSYHHYGKRGITICDRWLQSFENFLSDMGDRPSKHHSIDRINNNGNYCKENCRWAIQKEQVANRRNVEELQNEISILKEKLKQYEKVNELTSTPSNS